jgi:hypothetical protein
MHHHSLSHGERGAELLLAHCAALTPPEDPRRSAFVRLEETLGNDLARMLVGALAARRRERATFAPV